MTRSSIGATYDPIKIGQMFESAGVIPPQVWQRMRGPALRLAVCAGLACVVAMLLMFGERPSHQRTLEATTRMERLATSLSHAKVIAPATAREVGRLIQRPHYDCEQMTCDPTVETRNFSARLRLKMLLGAYAFPDAPAANKSSIRFSQRFE